MPAIALGSIRSLGTNSENFFITRFDSWLDVETERKLITGRSMLVDEANALTIPIRASCNFPILYRPIEIEQKR